MLRVHAAMQARPKQSKMLPRGNHLCAQPAKMRPPDEAARHGVDLEFLNRQFRKARQRQPGGLRDDRGRKRTFHRDGAQLLG